MEGAWPWPSTPSTADVKERVELYFFPLWPFMAYSNMNFTFFPLLLKFISQVIILQASKLFQLL